MPVIVDAEEVRRLTTRIFTACGAPPDEAAAVAGHLVTSNLMGYDTHGVIRVPQYVDDVRNGVIVPGARTTLHRETGSTAIVDGGWNFGQIGGLRGIEHAIEKAHVQGIAMVVVRRSNHAGRLGAYTQKAAEEGFLALGFCNSPIHGHFVLPWGGREGRLATNPVSYAIPTNWGFPLVADFSTAETSEGGIRLHRNLGKLLPEGWIVNADGEPTTDPGDFYGPPRGSILPFGGSKGYRGFALSLLVEILSGLLGGSRVTEKQSGNGLAFIVADIEAFLSRERFLELLSELRSYMKSSPPAAGFEEVMLPGEPDFRKLQQRSARGIPIDDQTRQQICIAAASLGIDAGPIFAESPASPH